MTLAPTLNIQAMWAGHTGPMPKTITPAEAFARLDIRIVPDQEPEVIVAALRRHFDGHGFGDVEIRPLAAERAWWTPSDHPVVQASAEAASEVVGRPPIVAVAAPGTVPMYQVCAAARVPATSLGTARADCRAHAPDENVRLDDLATATRITARFLERFSRLPEVPRVP